MGNILRLLRLNTEPARLRESRGFSDSINVKILKVIEPITLSVVLQVALLSHDLSDGNEPLIAILKLYDRRFAAGLRAGDYRYKAIQPWDPAHDDAFVALAQSDEASDYSGKDKDGNPIFPGEDWTVAQKEVFLYHQCLELYKAEVEAYHTLKPLQGMDIPELYANVCCLEGESTAAPAVSYLQVSGILLEFIPGFALRDIATHAPEEDWQVICDDAIATIHKIDDLGVLNHDVRIDNVLVRRLSNEETKRDIYKAVFIDFALSEVRGEMSAEDWTVKKCRQDEEGAIGYVMQARLKKRVGSRKKHTEVFPFTYQATGRYRHSEDGYKGPLGFFVRSD